MKRHLQRSLFSPEPEPLPPAAELDKAWAVIDAWRLHWYQLLFFQSPPLTSPDGLPFAVKVSEKHAHCMKVECLPGGYRRPEFDFVIVPGTPDAEVLHYCHLILEAIATSKVKVNAMACCPLAQYKDCVCAYAFTCPIHGEQHIGTHD